MDLFGGIEAAITGPRAKVKQNAAAALRKAPDKAKANVAKQIAKAEGLADLDLFAAAAVRSLDNLSRAAEVAIDEHNREPAKILEAITQQGDGQGGLRADDRKRRKSGRERVSSARMLEWAQDSGRILNPTPLVNMGGENHPQGGEHVVMFDPATARVVKLTKPGFFGAQGEDAGAYLERWALHNRAFGDDVAFEGLVTLPGEDLPRAVISQAFAQGRDATPQEQRDFLIEKGFIEAEDGRWIHPIREIVAWDTITPGNAILTESGVRIIDLQMATAPKDELEAIRERSGIGRQSLFPSAGPESAAVQDVHDGVVFAGADVQDGRSGTGPVEGRLDCASHVPDVGEVTALAAVDIDHGRLTVGEAAAERLQGEVGALAGSPDREEPQGEEAQFVEPEVETPPVLAVELGQCVGAEGDRVGRFLGWEQRVRATSAGSGGSRTFLPRRTSPLPRQLPSCLGGAAATSHRPDQWLSVAVPYRSSLQPEDPAFDAAGGAFGGREGRDEVLG
jgi:hypothetical protein